VPHPIFYFPVASTPEIYTLSLHDALPICRGLAGVPASQSEGADVLSSDRPSVPSAAAAGTAAAARRLRDLQHGSGRGVHALRGRSEEHTSELQSRENLVCRLLLEKKKLKR